MKLVPIQMMKCFLKVILAIASVTAFAAPDSRDVVFFSNSGISGKVTESVGLTPLEGIQVEVFRFNGNGWQWTAWDVTDGDGDYTISGLATGTYRVLFTDFSGDYLAEVYDGAQDLEAGTNIVVPPATIHERRLVSGCRSAGSRECRNHDDHPNNRFFVGILEADRVF